MNEKSTLSHTDTVKALFEVAYMSDKEIAINMPYIRQVAISAHTHLKTAGSKRDNLRKELQKAKKGDR